MIPKSITSELIQKSTSVFSDLCLYVAEKKNRIDGTAPADFPDGLKQMLLVMNLDTAIHHGGLWGYFGDITNDDGTVEEVSDVIEILKEMNAVRVAAVVEEALEVWREFVTGYLPARCRVNKKSFEEFQLSRTMRDTMESQLDPLDEEYYQAHGELARIIGKYVRENESQFIHPSQNDSVCERT